MGKQNQRKIDGVSMVITATIKANRKLLTPTNQTGNKLRKQQKTKSRNLINRTSTTWVSTKSSQASVPLQ